jgi:hypothetical protein
MAGSASATPEAMIVLAVQKLWYDIEPHPLLALSLIFSAQMLGYGVAGLLRKTLVYPTKMLYVYSSSDLQSSFLIFIQVSRQSPRGSAAGDFA